MTRVRHAFEGARSIPFHHCRARIGQSGSLEGGEIADVQFRILFTTQHASTKNRLSSLSGEIGTFLLKSHDVLTELAPIVPGFELHEAEEREEIAQRAVSESHRISFDESSEKDRERERLLGDGSTTETPAHQGIESSDSTRHLRLTVTNVFCKFISFINVRSGAEGEEKSLRASSRMTRYQPIWRRGPFS